MGRVAVMGAGSWGTAFAQICTDAGEDVLLWARRDEVAKTITAEHRNPDYLPDIQLPATLRATTDPAEALRDAEIVVLAVPSHALRTSLAQWRDELPRKALYVSLIKGVEDGSLQRGSQVITSELDLVPDAVVVVSGPNLAKECALRLPGATVAAGRHVQACERVQAMSHTPYFRVYTNSDIVGVELGGATKNAIAIAAGMADGLASGDNCKAMLMTRGLAEMTRLGVAQGGDPLTFSGLAGVGDLIATCMSPQSRNRGVGEKLARGEKLAAIIADMSMVAEGVKSSKAILAIGRAHGVDLPIVEGVVKVIHEGVDPQVIGRALMSREPKQEFHGLQATSRWGE